MISSIRSFKHGAGHFFFVGAEGGGYLAVLYGAQGDWGRVKRSGKYVSSPTYIVRLACETISYRGCNRLNSLCFLSFIA